MAQNNAPTSQASLARWWRQVLFVPMLHSKWLTSEAKARLTAKVTEAERGHRGEVFLIIENQLPIQAAYHIDCRERAVDLCLYLILRWRAGHVVALLSGLSRTR